MTAGALTEIMSDRIEVAPAGARTGDHRTEPRQARPWRRALKVIGALLGRSRLRMAIDSVERDTEREHGGRAEASKDWP